MSRGKSMAECPACGRRKATARSVLVALDDDSEVMLRALVCTSKGCHAESIRGVVFRARGLSPRTNPDAARTVADALARQAAEHRQQATNLVEEAAREETIAERYRSLHPSRQGPPLQNIVTPVPASQRLRSTLGGQRLLEADYSGVEIRIAARLSGAEPPIAEPPIAEPPDVESLFASLFGVPLGAKR